MLAVALAVSIAGLLVGPLVSPRALRGPRGMLVLDAVTLALVPGVIATRLVPHLIEEGGIAPAVGVVAGYVGFQLLELRAHRQASRLGVAIVVPALAVHALFDGAALGLVLGGRELDPESGMIVAAILLHRAPEGLFVACAMSGTRRASMWMVIGGLAVVTVAGALIGEHLVDAVPHELTHVGIAVGLGIMLRMVVDRHQQAVDVDARGRLASGLAFLGSLALLMAVPNPHDLLGTARAHELTIREALVPLFLETAPYLLATLIVAEIVAARLRLPVTRGEGADAWATASLLYAILLGPWIAALRAVVSPLVHAAGVVPQTIAWWCPRAREVLPTFTVGVLAAAVAEAFIPAQFFQTAAAVAVVPIAVIVGVALPLGAGTPIIAAVLVHKGVPLPAVLALVLGSSLRTYVRGWHRVFAMLFIGASVAPLAMLLDRSGVPSLHDLGAHHHAAFEWACSALLLVWIVIDLGRTGPRAWFERGHAPEPARGHHSHV